MNLDFLSLVVASLATYLLARTWVSSDVFKYPRDKAVGWLIKGEPPWPPARVAGRRAVTVRGR